MVATTPQKDTSRSGTNAQQESRKADHEYTHRGKREREERAEESEEERIKRKKVVSALVVGDSLVKGLVEDPYLENYTRLRRWDIRMRRGGKIAQIRRVLDTESG